MKLCAFLLAALDQSSRIQSGLQPSGVQSEKIAGLFWTFLWVCAGVYALTMLFMLISVARRKRTPGDAESVAVPPQRTESRIRIVVTSLTVVTTAILFALLLLDFFAGRSLAQLQDPNPLKIRITGHQWWWDVEYLDPTPSNIVRTANEIHIPVGRPVQLLLRSTDVIHSFWVPNLHGKRDLIPGHPTELWLRADKPGTYKGQCAEYCGDQHAKMRFLVIADTPEAFDAWLSAQRQPAVKPSNESTQGGFDTFHSSSCVMCHAIQGANAFASFGPNLTHFGSRQTLAGATLENNRGNLGGWIVDPQHIKPGVRMPQNALEPKKLQSLLDYLESLK